MPGMVTGAMCTITMSNDGSHNARQNPVAVGTFGAPGGPND